jgi:diguanylate cyclase (GGDEF)-like protein
MTRAQTLVLALLVLHVLLGGLSLAIGRGEHKSPALRWWGWALLIYSAGLAVTIVTPLLPRALALTVGNTLITIAPAMCAMAVLSYTRRALNWNWVWAGVAATAAALAFNNFGPVPRALGNLVLPTVMAVGMFLYGAWAISTDGPREAHAARQFLAGIMVLAVATWLARVGAMVTLLDGTNDTARIDAVISFFAIAQMVTGVGAALALFWIEVRMMQAELSRVAHTDALTGLANRRAVLVRFAEEASRTVRHGQRFGVAIFDLDHFKQVNDRFGHAVGDEVLKGAATALASAKRNEDILARIGGEEFVVILSPQQSIEGALEAAERLRAAVSAMELKAGGAALVVTASGGVALYPDDGSDWDALYAAADRRLYAAKGAGRNRVVARDGAGGDQPAGLKESYST